MDDSIIDLDEIDFRRVFADQNEIRRFNAQRHEMEQLDAVVFADKERGLCVGYKDVRPDEFWAKTAGCEHLPAVLMCETAAQLASFFVCKFDLMGHPLIGLGGLKNVTVFKSVSVGQRLVVALKQTRVRRGALIVCRFKGYVDQQKVIEGEIVGVPLPEA